MRDRAEQALYKLAMEPAWEAKFESNSYGFRPGRSAQDAIKAIWYASHSKESYVLDADISKCFDKISHKALLDKLAVAPHIRRQIKSWLVAGVIDRGELFPTTEGAPQGGPLSPLLMNIALHGMQTAVEATFAKVKRIDGKPTYIGKPKLIRYADDLVVVHHDLTVVEQAKQVVSEFLTPIGLELKPSKTRITNTLYEHEQNVGFDFLGFTVRQFPAGQTHTGKTNKKEAKPRGFKTLVKPSQQKQKKHLEKIKETTRHYGARRIDDLISALNLIIIGWCNYYAASNAKATFAKLDHQVWEILWRWVKRRHPHKTKYWLYDHYWPKDKFGVRQFTGKNGTTLYKHAKTKIKIHVKVEGKRSPYDGDWVYWGRRLREYPGLSTRKGKLLKWQMGKCVYCGLYFKDGDLTEVDHIRPRWAGGKSAYSNWQLLHRHCHDKKTVEDLALWEKEPPNSGKRGTIDKDQTTEEPDEVNVSSPVLQPSGGGDSIA
jgi:RNA-directed DNA polymerase